MFAIARTRRAFSLIELVIVVVIIGIIAAIAIPRMSRGSAGATDASLEADLKVLRNAIDLFATEHNGVYPDDVNATFINQMTTYTDEAGAASATKDATHIFGPYLREVPALPVGAKKGMSGVAAVTGASVGWLYNKTTGAVTANTTTEADAKGKLYNTY